MIADLTYFAEGDDGSYNQCEVRHFTHKWRKRTIETLDAFKVYHQKFLKLLGKAIGTGAISDQECSQNFWEGIPRSLCQRIETRLLVLNPQLDVSEPFKMEDIVQAVKAIFNRK